MKTGVRYGFSLLSGHYWSNRTEGRAGFQVAGGEALRVSSKLTLFPLSVCPPFQNQYIVPEASSAGARGTSMGQSVCTGT